MPEVLQTYLIGAFPDRTDPQEQRQAPDGVCAAIGEGTKLLMHALSAMPPGSAALTLLFVFTPSTRPEARQSRLKIYLKAWACDQETADVLSLLIERGPLAQFYSFERTEELRIPWEKMGALCDVQRKEDQIQPLYGPEANAKIPPAYYLVRPFIPNPQNDWLVLDSILDNVAEPVVVSICIEPPDLSLDRAGLTAYAADVEGVNHPFDEEGLFPEALSLLDDEKAWRSSRDKSVPLPRKKDPLADNVFREIRKVLETLHDPHLLFNVCAMSGSEETARLIASVVAGSAFEENRYQLSAHRAGEGDLARILEETQRCRAVLTPTLGASLESAYGRRYANLSRLAQMAACKELSGLFRPPIGTQRSPRCFRQNTDPPLYNLDSLLVLGYDEAPRAGAAGTHGMPRGIRWKDLPKHVSIFGMPGSGKTTALMNMMLQCYRRGIPFLFLAPIGGEQALIKKLMGHPDKEIQGLARALRVFTPGNDDVSPLCLTPLKRCPGIPLDQHIEELMECFKGAVPMFPAFEGVLHEALRLVYREHPDPERPPHMGHLVEAAERVLERKGYVGETNSNLHAANQNRLRRLCEGSAGKVFQCGENIPSIEDLIQGCSLIELNALPVEQSAIFILFFLKAVKNLLTSTPHDGGGPRLVIFLDESHLVVGRQSGLHQAEDFVDPKHHAAQQVCRMLAEFRKLGVGVILADQSPAAVSPEVVKLTRSKLAFLTTEKEDRETLGGAMLFTAYEMEEVARLLPGEAFFITKGYHRPRKTWTINLSERMDLSRPPTNTELRAFIASDPWYLDAREARSAALLSRLLEAMDVFDNTRLAIARKAGALCRSKEDGNAGREAGRLYRALQSQFKDFLEGSYADFLGEDVPTDSEALKSFRARVRSRCENVMAPDCKACLELLGASVK